MSEKPDWDHVIGLRDDYLSQRHAKTDSAVKSLLECGMYKGDTDGIELAIMRAGIDYDGARAIVATLSAALFNRYAHCGLDGLVQDRFDKLEMALGEAEEPEPDPRAGEDAELDDNRRW